MKRPGNKPGSKIPVFEIANTLNLFGEISSCIRECQRHKQEMKRLENDREIGLAEIDSRLKRELESLQLQREAAGHQFKLLEKSLENVRENNGRNWDQMDFLLKQICQADLDQETRRLLCGLWSSSMEKTLEFQQQAFRVSLGNSPSGAGGCLPETVFQRSVQGSMQALPEEV